MWSANVIVIMYIIIAIIFIPLGAAIYIQSRNLYSSPRLRYDNVDRCDVGNETLNNETKTCLIRFDIDKNVTAPAYFYYGMVNFYQNARTYVSSRSETQLRGNDNPSTDTCSPAETDANGTVLVPCGLAAQSFFNDSFELCRTARCQPSNVVQFNGTNISWEVDRNQRFLNSTSFTQEQANLITSEDFMVWMRLAAYRNWKKLYRRVEEDLEAGRYFVRIRASYPVESFEGEKFFFLAETSWFGGPNEALGLGYLVVGGICLCVAIAFAIRSRMLLNLDLPPETTVNLEGFVKHPVQSYAPSLENPSV